MKLQRIHKSIKCPIAYITTFLCLLFFMIIAACIPVDKIKPKMLESAEFMCERSTSYLITDWIHASQMDRYADCITLSIAHQLDEDNPLESAMWTSFYRGSSHNMNYDLLESVQNDLPATQEYMRYWHGSAAAMRILHLLWNVKEIYAFHAVLMALLGIILILLLAKRGYLSEAVSFLFSMIIISVWYVPLCLEYTCCFICMLVAAIAGVLMATNKKDDWFGPFFLIVGMVTVYFDFLTCETLTLLIPLLLICRIQRSDGNNIQLIWKTVKYAIAWTIGYLGMWAAKWAMASIVLKIDVMPYVRGHIDERLNQAVSGTGITGNAVFDAITRNLKKLIPYEYGIYGAIALLVFILVAIVFPVIMGKIALRKNIQTINCFVYAVLGLIPYIRYIVLRNHSIIHSFFTYRAQAATILAVCLIVLELVEPASRRAVPVHE